jgi:uncharacterized protein (TIGR03437 family)
MISRSSSILLYLLGLSLPGVASTSITVTNPGFETLPANPAWINCAGSGAAGSGGAGCRDTMDGNVPGWTASNTTSIGLFQPGPNYFTLPLPAAEGQTIVQINAGTLSQVLSQTLQVSTVYTLQVDVGQRSDKLYPSPPPTVQLFAGSTLIASATGAQPPLGGWTTWTGTYQSGASDPLAGQALKIVLGSTSPQGDFDNVQLTSAPVASLPPPCSYALNATSAAPAASGGAGSVTVTAGTGCSWTAASNASWITITAGASGSGNGSVSYNVAANTATTSRTGTLTVAGQTFTITQAAASTPPACSYVLGATSAAPAASGGSASVTVTAGTGCSWTAASNASWITITAGASGSGNGSVSYNVAANTATTSRTGTLTVAGQTFTITQAAASTTPPAGNLPQISAGGVLDGADYSPSLSPGSIMLIYGTNLYAGTNLVAAPSMPLPTSLSGTSVEVVDGTRILTAPLYWVTAGEVSAQVPFEITSSNPQVRVRTAAGVSATAPMQILPVAPRLFTKTMNGLGEPLVFHGADGTIVSSTSPAQANEYLVMCLSGLGAVSPSLASGVQGGDTQSLGPLNVVKAPVQITVGGVNAPFVWAGIMPGFVGVYQLNFQMPSTVVAGTYPIVVSAGGQQSQGQVAVAAGDIPLLLFDNWNTAACSLVNSSGFDLVENDYATSLQAWYQWKTGETSVSYTLSQNGQKVSSGSLTRSSCDPNQASWCGATTNLGATLPAGAYTLTLGTTQMCANSGSNGAGFVRLYGVPSGGGWTTLQTATVTAAGGGTLSATGASIQVSAGAFAQDTIVSLGTLNKAPAPTGGIVSAFYRLEGVPSTVNAPITVTLDPAAPIPDGEVFLVMQPDNTDPEVGPTVFPAQVVNGKLVSQLPAYPQGPTPGAQMELSRLRASLAGPNPDATLATDSKVTWMLWMMAGLSPSTSSQGHFIIHMPKGYTSVEQQLDQSLEYAWTQISNLGLSWLKRGNSAIEIYVFSYNSWWSVILGGSSGGEGANPGNEETEFWAKDNIGLCINLDPIAGGDASALGDARITAGHELLHVMQSQYDPRAYFVTMRSSPWLWMDEASAVWFEKVMTADPNYVDTIASGNLDYLLKAGLEMTTTWGGLGIGPSTVQNHGYGASSFLQFLAPASPGNPDTRIGDVLKLMATPSTIGLTASSEYSATQALGMVFSNLPAQWVSYCQKWLEQNLYAGPINYPTFQQVTNSVAADGYAASDQPFSGTSVTLTYSGTDLSAQLYRIDFPSSLNWQANTKMTFTLTGPSGAATALVYKLAGHTGNNFNPYQTITSTYTENNAEQFISQNASLVILLVNSNYVVPYTNTSTITLTMQVASTPTKNPTSIELSFDSGCSDASGNSAYCGIDLNSSPNGTLTWTGNHFSTNVQYTIPQSLGVVSEQFSISGDMDSTRTTITQVQFSETRILKQSWGQNSVSTSTYVTNGTATKVVYVAPPFNDFELDEDQGSTLLMTQTLDIANPPPSESTHYAGAQSSQPVSPSTDAYYMFSIVFK